MAVERDGYRLARSGPSPDGRGLVALQDHVVPDHCGEPDLGAGLPGLSEEKGHEGNPIPQGADEASLPRGGSAVLVGVGEGGGVHDGNGVQARVGQMR